MMKKKVLLLLSLLLPWLLAPAMFALAVAAVRAWNTDSLITALVFVGTLAPSSLTFNGVFLSTCWSFSPRRSLRPIFLLRCCYLCAVLPLAAWIAAQRSCCKDAIQEPVFAPSFVAAIIATTCGTYVAILRPGSHNKLLLLLLQAAADQQQFRKLQFCNILAVKYISFFDCHACMLAENSKKLQKERKPLLDRRKKLCLQFSLSMPCLDRRRRSHVFCLHCNSL
jgi:hypothetical protein